MTHRSADGTLWEVKVQLPGSSNAMIVFRHPAGATSRLDRYNWFLSGGPEARSVTSHLSADTVLAQLDPPAVARLFNRSMPVSKPALSAGKALGV